MSQATIPVTITTFRPMNGNTTAAARGTDVIDATFGPFNNDNDDGFTIAVGGDGKSLIITRAQNAKGTLVNLNFVLPSTAYVLNGIAFVYNNTDRDISREVFPQFHSDRTDSGSSICVDDNFSSADQAGAFTYVILVEERATDRIGIIDPGISNEMEPHS